MHDAIKGEHARAVKTLLRLGARLTLRDGSGREPIHVAADEGNLAICKLLVDAGADIDKPDLEGYTPLATAVARGQCDVATYFLENGADLSFYVKNMVADVKAVAISQGGEMEAIAKAHIARVGLSHALAARAQGARP